MVRTLLMDWLTEHPSYRVITKGVGQEMDWLAEHGFVETQCYVCHEALILPAERYEKYVAYKHDWCKRSVNLHWKSQLVGLTMLFSPILLTPVVIVWPSLMNLWGMYIIAWGVTITIGVIVAFIYGLIYDTGSY